MTSSHTRPLLVLWLAAAALPVHAEGLAISASSAGSSAASAGSASSRGSSNSIQGSSDSSGTPRAALEGEYRVARVEPSLDGRPETTRLTLDPIAAGASGPVDSGGGASGVAAAGTAGGVRLVLPQRAIAARPLAVGDRVLARQRPYGWEFARAETREAFFLVLDDASHRDLQTRVVAVEPGFR